MFSWLVIQLRLLCAAMKVNKWGIKFCQWTSLIAYKFLKENQGYIEMRLASSKSVWSLAVLVTAVMYRKVAIDYLKTNKKIFSKVFLVLFL